MLSSFLKTGLISAIFIKFGNLFSFRQSLKTPASFPQKQIAKFFIIEIDKSFDIDALFEGNFLTASVISSFHIDLREKLSST